MDRPTVQQQLTAARQALGLVRAAASGATEDALVWRFHQADDRDLVATALAQMGPVIGRAIGRAAGMAPDAVDKLLAALDASFDGDQIVFIRADAGLN